MSFERGERGARECGGMTMEAPLREQGAPAATDTVARGCVPPLSLSHRSLSFSTPTSSISHPFHFFRSPHQLAQPTTGARLSLPQLRRPDPRAAEGHRRVHLCQPRDRLDEAHRAVLRARADLHAVQVRRRRRARLGPYARDRDVPRDAVRVPGQVCGAAERRVQGQVKRMLQWRGYRVWVKRMRGEAKTS